MLNIFRLYITFHIILLVNLSKVAAQSFLNGSFENTTSPLSCQYNLTNTMFNSVMASTNAFGVGDECDIVIAGCFNPSIPNGIRAVALSNQPGDEISMTLSSPLTMGNSYTISFDALAVTNFNPQGNIEIGASLTNSSFGSSIFTAVTTPSVWTSYTFTFTAPNNAQYITARNVISGVTSPWNHIDNFSIIGCSLFIDLGNDTTICQGETLILDATTINATYLWQDNSTNPTFNVTQQGTYWVQITDSCGSTTDTILIDEETCEIILEIPNVFTPNNDDINDLFVPIISKGIVSMNTIIYNRWGKKVYETNNLLIEWNGQDVSDGTYFWIVYYTDINAVENSLKGYVTILK